MKLTFELIVHTNLDIFNAMVNQRLEEGWKFLGDKPHIITPYKRGLQYSIPMLLEEGQPDVQGA